MTLGVILMNLVFCVKLKENEAFLDTVSGKGNFKRFFQLL